MTEILSIPEENLAEVILVIRMGVVKTFDTISQNTRMNLLKWCDEEEEYLKRLGG